MSTAHKVSIQEAAGFLECSEDRVLELIREGKLAAIKAGKAWVIPRETFFEDVYALARENTRPRPSPIKPHIPQPKRDSDFTLF